jgi:hypothetical protein
VSEYRETGYGSDRYPPRDAGDPDGGGTVYRGGARHTGDQESPAGHDDHGYAETDSAYDPAASIRGRVWRPTRGPRAEGANPGYGAPERGWRTSDGGYRSPEGGWHAPYPRPYDTGEWRRDQHPDTGPTSTGEIPPYSSGAGEIVRYTPPVTVEPPAYWAGPADVANSPVRPDRAPESPPHTGEIVRYSNTGEAPGYPANGAAGGPTTGVSRYPGAASPRSTGEFAPYSATPDMRGTEAPRYPADEGAGRGRYDTDGHGRRADGGRYETDGRGRRPDGTRYDTEGRGRRADTGGFAAAAGSGRTAGAAGGAGMARRHPSETGETARIPRQLPTSPASYPPPAPNRRAIESGGRRNDSPELYEYDPLTFGGGESPAMRFDPATESFHYDAAEPPSGVPDPRRAPRPTVDPRTADPRYSDPRFNDPRFDDLRGANPRAIEPRTASYQARAIEARAAEARANWARTTRAGEYDSRGSNGRAPDAGVYGGPRYQREPAPGQRDDMPARRPAERRYDDQPPVRRAPARPQQRFEGTYPPRSVRNTRNVVPMQGRPGLGPDEDEEDAPGFLHTALVTTAWYTIPLLLYTMYVLTLDGSAQAGDGQSPRENALNGLLGGMPRVCVALVTSLAVALLIRLIGRGWRAATIGFASAVVGGGVATVIFTALTG